jgi:hypothetical protein
MYCSCTGCACLRSWWFAGALDVFLMYTVVALVVPMVCWVCCCAGCAFDLGLLSHQLCPSQLGLLLTGCVVLIVFYVGVLGEPLR